MGGSLSGAPYRGRGGREAQATHGREGDAGHTVRLGGQMGETSSSPTIATQLQRIAEQAKQYPAMVFTTLAHLIDVEFLREAYHRTRKDSAPGIDGVMAEAYAEHREENLRDLHERLVPILRRPLSRPTAPVGGAAQPATLYYKKEVGRKNPPVAIYARVSSEQQTDAYTIAIQLAALRARCNRPAPRP